MNNPGQMLGDAYRFAPAAPEEDIVYGACSPGWHSAGTHEQAIDDWIEFMQASGIERVCCLLAGRQLDASDANVGRYRDAFGSENVCHAPIPDNRMVDHATLRETILPFLEDADSADEPVVVHCLAGLGRTGQVLAAWLVHARGYASDDAVATVRELGRDPTEGVKRGSANRQELFDLLEALA